MSDTISKASSFKKNVSKAFSFFKKKAFKGDDNNIALKGKENLYILNQAIPSMVL